MRKTQPQTKPRSTHPAHRSASRRLDPYTVVGTTLTLQEWRRTRDVQEPVHIVLREVDKHVA
jgi:hypothetical protein